MRTDPWGMANNWTQFTEEERQVCLRQIGIDLLNGIWPCDVGTEQDVFPLCHPCQWSDLFRITSHHWNGIAQILRVLNLRMFQCKVLGLQRMPSSTGPMVGTQYARLLPFILLYIRVMYSGITFPLLCRNAYKKAALKASVLWDHDSLKYKL